MNDTSQHEFDDELLSAYLDDELSVEERAVVEARLEADPAAQQLLEQLRAASQAVQRLPQEALGRDLTEAVLERVKPGKPSPFPLPKGEGSELPMPRLSVGRTKRGWVWAALAIAAALLLMFVQSNDQLNNNLPAVAKRDNESAKVASDVQISRRQLGREPVLSPAPESAASEPAAPESLTAETAAPSGAAAPGEAYYDKSLVNEATASKPAGESTPSLIGRARGAPLAQDELAKERSVEFSGGPAAGALADSSPRPLAEDVDELKQDAKRDTAPLGGAKGKLPSEGRSSSLALSAEESSADDESLIVVNVVARPEAIGKKTFDKILSDNGVFFDSDGAAASEEFGVADGNRIAESQPARAAESADRAAEAPPADAGDAVDAVLVEAPPKIIADCVERLNEDHDNYVGLDVEESSSLDVSDKSVALKSGVAKITVAKQLATDLGRYRRGIVTQKQKQLAAVDQRRLEVARDRQVGDYRFDEGAGFGGAIAGSEIQSKRESAEVVDGKDALAQNAGRAPKAAPQ